MPPRSNYFSLQDYACVDQEGPAKGVNALPMILAQCNAVISLVDEGYYTRAWCSLEVLMVQTLKKSYGLHLWYEYVYTGDNRWDLRPGSMDLQVSMTEKKVTMEADRAKIMFLERQVALFGF